MGTPGEIGENVRRFRAALHDELARLGRTPESVTLVAVSKTFGPDFVDAAALAGLSEFGENRVQEAAGKISQVAAPGLRWHLIGHLQVNKARDAVRLFDLVHSVDSLELARALDHRAEAAGKRQEVLLQVNTTAESQKSGCTPAEAEELAGQIAALPNLRLMGLMTIGPFVSDHAPIAVAFRQLRGLFDRLSAAELHGGAMRYCSMGMSDDWRIALAEGANMLRIGRAIFGERG